MNTKPLAKPGDRRFCRKMMLAGLLATALLTVGCDKKIDDDDVVSRRIELRDVASAVEKNDAKTLILDSRLIEEYDAAHIPGARRVDPYSIDTTRRDPKLSGAKSLIIYGKHRNDPRALVLGKRLLTAEYKGVKYFEEGFEAWNRAGKPVDGKSPSPAPSTPPADGAPSRATGG